MKGLLAFGGCFIAGLVGGVILAALVAGETHSAVFVREWVGALSGWVGAGGAALAAWVTIRAMRGQIDVAQGQLAEARRQTDFVIGDALPTVYLTNAGNGLGNLTLNVLNWNRRPFVIQKIYETPLSELHVERYAFNGSYIFNEDPEMPAQLWEPIYVAGWLDRAGPPTRIELTISAIRKPKQPEAERYFIEVVVAGTLIGDRHQKLELTAELRAVARR